VAVRAQGYRATKFGWGPYGRGSVATDREHVESARDGFGDDGILLIDAGTVWVDDVETAAKRLEALKDVRATWLEEPFHSGAIDAYHQLSKQSGAVKLAGGEGAHDFHMARHMIDHAGIGFVQIDTGRIGGITTAKQVADYAASKGLQFVNHTFTTQLSLSASLQPFAGLKESDLCEYPVEASEMARALTKEKIEIGAGGMVSAPDRAGLGVTVDPEVVKKYLVQTEITVGRTTIYRTPEV
jgi:L-alanine-DL-glutamate epimerase-like enolase superfamily enzyme